MSSTSRGLAPHEGLELLLLKLSRTRPSMEPRSGPQAGKSGYPRIQNTDSDIRVMLVLNFGTKIILVLRFAVACMYGLLVM